MKFILTQNSSPSDIRLPFRKEELLLFAEARALWWFDFGRPDRIVITLTIGQLAKRYKNDILYIIDTCISCKVVVVGRLWSEYFVNLKIPKDYTVQV